MFTTLALCLCPANHNSERLIEALATGRTLLEDTSADGGAVAETVINSAMNLLKSPYEVSNVSTHPYVANLLCIGGCIGGVINSAV